MFLSVKISVGLFGMLTLDELDLHNGKIGQMVTLDNRSKG